MKDPYKSEDGMKIENDLKGRIEQIDTEQFFAAFEQYKKGDLTLANKYMSMDSDCSPTRAVRMAYFAAIKCEASEAHGLARDCFFLGMECFLFPKRTPDMGYPYSCSNFKKVYLEAAGKEKKMTKIEQIDGEEFKSAVKQLRLRNTALCDKFIHRVGALTPVNSVNVARMEYLVACALTASGRHRSAMEKLFSVAETLLGIEIEEKS